MIIKTDEELEPGKVYGNRPETSLTDMNSIEHKQIPFLVLRRASIMEYIDYVTSQGIHNFPIDRKNFYEVSID